MKIFGGALIILASVFSSYCYEKSLKEKINKLGDVINFLAYIGRQIDYFSSPLKKIFNDYENKTDTVNCLIENKTVYGLDGDITLKINSCFSSLGEVYKREQLTVINYTLCEVQEKLKMMENSKSDKIKVFRAISLFVGISFVILLV